MNRLYGMGSASVLAAALMVAHGAESVGRLYDVEVTPQNRRRAPAKAYPPVEVDAHYKTRAEEKRARKAAKRAAHA